MAPSPTVGSPPPPGDPRRTTTDGRSPAPGCEDGPAPQPIDPATGQHGAYWILSEAERAKGFVRPVRESYLHVGQRVCGRLDDGPAPVGFVAMVCVLPPGHQGDCSLRRGASAVALQRLRRTGRLGGCGSATRMGRALAETYARDPKFYGATFCCGCRAHFPVAEFVWDGDGEVVGS